MDPGMRRGRFGRLRSALQCCAALFLVSVRVNIAIQMVYMQAIKLARAGDPVLPLS